MLLFVFVFFVFFVRNSYVFGGHTGSLVTNELRVLNITAGAQTAAPVPTKTAGGIDGVIAKMQSLIGAKPGTPGTSAILSENELIWLCDLARNAFMQEGTLVEVPVPAQLYGDIHGQFYDLLKLFKHFGWPNESKSFVFLGDYGTLLFSAFFPVMLMSFVQWIAASSRSRP